MLDCAHGAASGVSPETFRNAGAKVTVIGADPDGNEFEIMWMLPREAWGEYESAAPVDRLDLSAELARWSGVRTAGQVVPER